MESAGIEAKLDAAEEAKEEQIAEEVAPAPKKRGKKKPEKAAKKEDVPKVNIAELPPDLIEVIAVAPIIIAAAATKTLTTQKDAQGNVTIEGITLRPSSQALAAIPPAFKAWLATLDVELTPGVMLLTCYAMALTTALPDVMVQLAERADKQKVAENANPSSGAKASNDSAGSESPNPPQAA